MGLLDYGSGNLHSAARAFSNAGAEVVVSSDHDKLWQQDALVVPGVGAYASCMAGLAGVDGVGLIRRWVEAQRLLLGICVGHQILFGAGHEHGMRTEGVGIYDGEVTRLESQRLPHMGWNTVSAPQGSTLFAGLAERHFYFVHSYAAHESPDGALVATATHEDDVFVAAVENGPVSSTQFHPEKSGAAGAALIANWLTH